MFPTCGSSVKCYAIPVAGDWILAIYLRTGDPHQQIVSATLYMDTQSYGGFYLVGNNEWRFAANQMASPRVDQIVVRLVALTMQQLVGRNSKITFTT